MRAGERKGAALLFAIFVMMIASALVVSMAESQMTRYAALRNTRDWDDARYIAEAGLHHALSELENDITWRTGIPETEFPIGSGRYYTANVRDGLDGTVLIKVQGRSGGFSRTLTATVKQGG